MCEALRDGKPGSLRTSENGGNVVLNWDAPGYQADSVTGYQVLRRVSGAAPDVHVADTGTTDTAWTDENPPAGDPVSVVRAIYDDYYLGPASVPTNIRATGAPGIVGTAQAGSTLMADTSGIGDANGLTTVSYSYQWISNDGTSDSDITNAARLHLHSRGRRRGKTIKVKVSFTDDAGHDETLTSEATDPVAPLPNSPATGAPAITGTMRAGETLTASTSGIEDADGMDTVAYSYQWLADDTDIAGATSASYTLTDSEEGNVIKVRVSFTDDAGNEESLTSPPIDPSRPYGLTATVSGSAVVLNWNPPVGFQYLYKYQILRNRPELGETEPIVYVDTGTAETTNTDTDVEAWSAVRVPGEGGELLRPNQQGVGACRDSDPGIPDQRRDRYSGIPADPSDRQHSRRAGKPRRGEFLHFRTAVQ